MSVDKEKIDRLIQETGGVNEITAWIEQARKCLTVVTCSDCYSTLLMLGSRDGKKEAYKAVIELSLEDLKDLHKLTSAIILKSIIEPRGAECDATLH